MIWRKLKEHKMGGMVPPFLMAAMILKLLSEKPMHGYQIAEEISKMLEKEVPRPVIYFALKKLEKDGFLTFKWEMQEKGPARKIYYITEEGEELLKLKMELLKKFYNLLGKLLGEENSG